LADLLICTPDWSEKNNVQEAKRRKAEQTNSFSYVLKEAKTNSKLGWDGVLGRV
jgi:hypothetical protein